ncbi:hypothetical protein OsJ_33263 [Oryza sativa Japonica Group]|uniref:Uncharacterized protein n=1 Tax=Oryza sativa subsp. japonica TaxID=39947 RepID=B9G9U5_ORYSJ|nr:hypothetical protein OsJ_33263 [Oryza sativa Japonica Group]
MIGGGGADDGGSDRRKKRRAELEVAIKGTLAVQAYIRITCTIMAYLAFTWSTVVLLGGYVSSLQRKDFQCLTVITVIEATRMIGGGGADDGGSDRRKKRRAELEVAIKGTLAVQAYIRITCTIMAYLAFTWSTVVLLGGYVSSLQRKDFQCLTVITVIEATRLVD